VSSQFAVSFFNKGKTYELQDYGNLVVSEDTVNGSYYSDDLEKKAIVKEGLAAGITDRFHNDTKSYPCR
jgi:AP endonuclease-2